MTEPWDPGRTRRASKLHGFSRLIRIEHTVFSLPFAYAGMAMTRQPFGLREVILATLAVIGLRSAAMAYNNIADYDIDRLNPRSAHRPLIVGLVDFRDAWLAVLLGSMIYYASSLLLNIYAFELSPLLWALAMSYPYAKRLHWLPHVHLGSTLAMVVFGGSVAVSGTHACCLAEALSNVPWLFMASVLFWVAGFDVYYSILDLDFDREHGLGSIPSRLGITRGLYSAFLMHLVSLVFLWSSMLAYKAGRIAWTSVIMASFILFLEARWAWSATPSGIRRAFNLNLIFSLILSTGVIIDFIS